MFNKTNSQPSTAKGAAKSTDNAKRTTAARPASRASTSVPSILAADLKIIGDIITDGDVQIEGQLEGNVKAATLTIGEKGFVNGVVTAGTCHIRGKVKGQIEATVVELAETANVEADITQDQLTIANGAFFDGKCQRKTKAAAKD